MIALKGNFSCGRRIKELRVERSLSQERLALNAGITPAYLGLVEREQRNATVVTIEKICAALNVSLADFFAVSNYSEPLERDVGRQILSQLNGLNNEEKLAMLQLVKDVLHIRQIKTEAE